MIYSKFGKFGAKFRLKSYQSLLLLFVDQGYCFTRQSIKRNSINHSMHQKLSISGKLIHLKDKLSMKKS